MTDEERREYIRREELRREEDKKSQQIDHDTLIKFIAKTEANYVNICAKLEKIMMMNNSCRTDSTGRTKTLNDAIDSKFDKIVAYWLFGILISLMITTIGVGIKYVIEDSKANENFRISIDHIHDRNKDVDIFLKDLKYK